MRKQPQQERSRKTREQLMTALNDLLRDHEFDQITVADIARKAGVSTGLLYAHFENKADFLAALLDEYKARVIARLEQVEHGDLMSEYEEAGGLRQALHLIAEHAYAQLVEDAHIIRTVSRVIRTHLGLDGSEWQDLRQRARRTITPILDVYADQLVRPNDERTAEMLVYFFNTIFVDALLFHKPGQASVDKIGQEAFITEITDFAYGYLTTGQR